LEGLKEDLTLLSKLERRSSRIRRENIRQHFRHRRKDTWERKEASVRINEERQITSEKVGRKEAFAEDNWLSN
jgi:hypothetical protein